MLFYLVNLQIKSTISENFFILTYFLWDFETNNINRHIYHLKDWLIHICKKTIFF